MIFSRKNLSIIAMIAMVSIASCEDGQKKAEEEKARIEAEAQVAADEAEAEAARKEEAMRKEAEASSIAAKAMGTESLSTLVTALKGADLVPMMSQPGEYTVFAPSNDAFGDLPNGTVEELLKPENKETLTNLLKYHVVQGVIDSEKLANAIKGANGSYEFQTIGGGALTASMKGDQIYIKDARGKTAQVILGNVEASNGIAHVIDQVLMQKK